jgi:uncharacterized protein YbaA (DUF1428 family)
MSYVDGFVIPVPKRKVAAYRKMAQLGKRIWMKHGALEYFECVADDLSSTPGAGGFKEMAKLKPGETVFFSFIVYRSKAHRNAVNKKVMASMPPWPEKMPFDVKRMAVGGFRALVEARRD